MDSKPIVIYLSVGTFLAVCLATCCLCISIVVGGSASNPRIEEYPYTPQRGAVGDLDRLKNDALYGPVNMSAAHEVKEGLFDRFRIRRINRVCPPQQCYVPQRVTTTITTFTPQQTSKTIPAIEFPAVIPIKPAADCPDGLCPLPRSEAVKTGSFICTNCRQPKVGKEWHTDWGVDGTPITFLCAHCYSFMTSVQREIAFASYQRRQGQSTHQEIGN